MATPIIAGNGTGGKGERKLIKVPSASRPGTVHFVDPDAGRCSCRGFAAHGHCYHVESLWCANCLGYGTTISYPKLCECGVCGGSGRAA